MKIEFKKLPKPIDIDDEIDREIATLSENLNNPGLIKRFLGFIPIIGPVFGLIRAILFAKKAMRLSDDWILKIKMCRNILITCFCNLIFPKIGDLIFNCNKKNVKLLLKEVKKRKIKTKEKYSQPKTPSIIG